MKKEFEFLFDLLKNTHYKRNGDIWEAEPDSQYATSETAGEFMDIIEKLMFIKPISVEICGSWVWVGGDTKSYKGMLKEMGFWYSSQKKMWYHHRQVKRRHSNKWTIEQIRSVYGSKQYKGKREQIEVKEEKK